MMGFNLKTMTGDHFVGKLSTMCHPTKPSQPSISSVLVNV